MTIQELKREIEEKTLYRFHMGKDRLGNDELQLLGLPKEMYLSVRVRQAHNGANFISVSGENRKEQSGFGSPCNNLAEVVQCLYVHANRYGWKGEPEQLCIF